jgi:hypothetical protein
MEFVFVFLKKNYHQRNGVTDKNANGEEIDVQG